MSAAELLLTLAVVAGTAGLTLGVIGLIRTPDSFVKVHAMSTAVVVGPVAICPVALLTGQADLLLRALLVGGFLLATSPVAAHRIVRLGMRRPREAASAAERQQDARDAGRPR